MSEDRVTPESYNNILNWRLLVVEVITKIREIEVSEEALQSLPVSRVFQIGRRVEIYRQWQFLAKVLIELDHIRQRRRQ